jgi:hypothetical protein
MYYFSINDVVLRKCYDIDTNTSFYDVYNKPIYEEELVGDYIGEFTTDYDLDENEDLFIAELEDWLLAFNH